MGLILNHDSGIQGAYVHIRQTNCTKNHQVVILDVYFSKQAYQDGKPPIGNSIEAHGIHKLEEVGNVWQKGYAIAKKHEKLKNATDDI